MSSVILQRKNSTASFLKTVTLNAIALKAKGHDKIIVVTMKKIEIDDELYSYIASHTRHIGESASDILRRLLDLNPSKAAANTPPQQVRKAGGRRVFDIVTRADLATQRGAVGRFLYILGALHRCHPEEFVHVLDIRGRDRLYFGTSEQQLEASGNSTNPKQIPDSPYWVVTNTNTTRKKSMITAVAQGLGYSTEEAEKIRDFL